MQPYDDERYEHHLHHLHHDTGGALYHFDHHLSHLIQRGDLGDISEKQLRCQLEFETLCHLQMSQQQSPGNLLPFSRALGYLPQPSEVPYPSHIAYHKALSSSSSNVSASHSSTDAAPSSSLTSSDRDSGHASSQHSSHDMGTREPGQDLGRQTGMEPEEALERDEGEIAVSPDFQQCLLPSHQHSQDSIPLEDFTGHTSSWPGSTETTLNQSDSPGGSTSWSGGAEVCSILSHDSQDSLAGKESLSRDRLSGKESLSRDSLAGKESLSRDSLAGKDLAGKESLSRDGLAGKESLSRDSLTVPGRETKGSHRSLAHHSSGSEHESFPHLVKARCLRKTKSRGKGKGCLTPGLDELGFDNDAYSSDSSSEHSGDKDPSQKTGPRECWT
ncbi:hypothetical protein NP493_490g00000 [Ridgeia piscesae]|uniref:Uncharacterized protein n=1 Tax=Ridgeia piscesae TaxID=27915 RepID=A0AAD9NR92_RIDPI|nr:hypothetical protein NP493_490g00000 [Ridgeia piscesae]